MALLLAIAHLLLYLLMILLLARIVLDYVRQFARAWRPAGTVAVGVETVYTLTDPPVNLCAG